MSVLVRLLVLISLVFDLSKLVSLLCRVRLSNVRLGSRVFIGEVIASSFFTVTFVRFNSPFAFSKGPLLCQTEPRNAAGLAQFESRVSLLRARAFDRCLLPTL